MLFGEVKGAGFSTAERDVFQAGGGVEVDFEGERSLTVAPL
jgi:hypothetical protein